MIAHVIIRILFILFGYALATVASGVVVGLVFATAESSALNDVPGILAMAIILIGMYAALPALATVIIGEAIALRRRLYYIIAATLIGMVLPVLVGMPSWYVLVGLGFGPVAGLIYWTVSGKRAGLRRQGPA